MPDTIQPGDSESFDGRWNRRHFIIKIATFNRWNDDERNVNVNRNDNDWNDNWWFAGVRKSLHFPVLLKGAGFCLSRVNSADFVSCPFHPPSIFPMSSKGKERAIYFLFSNDFVSQRTSSKILTVSNFLIANRTYGCFSLGDRKLAIETASMISTNKVSILWPKVCR